MDVLIVMDGIPGADQLIGPSHVLDEFPIVVGARESCDIRVDGLWISETLRIDLMLHEGSTLDLR